jgi:Holliday junction resolvase RusA-like endonuclease
MPPKKINIKPLSVNQCWQGKRFKTKDYVKYESDVLLMLPKIQLPDAPFTVVLNFGVSSPLADIDNPVKPILDILQKKYGFNDRDINWLLINKQIVKKGNEFIEFEICKDTQRFI